MKKLLFVKKTLAVAAASLLAIPALAVWTVKDGKLLDPNGNPFVFRGVTIDGTLAPEKIVQGIKDASTAGANAVQLEISTNVYNHINHPITVEQLRSVIQACKDNKVVCVLEPNDAAGFPNAQGSASPDATMGFWSYPAFPALIGQQDYVILGMGNQALGDIPPGEYTARMQSYVGNFIRSYPGFLVMIDGSNWGQDATKEMLAFAEQNMKGNGYYAKNLIYSVEMFDAYTDPEKVRDYIASFAQIGAPLVIGGFAPTPYYHPHNNSPITTVALQLPAASVMEYAQQYSTGYFAWNWSGSSNPGLNLVTDWDANKLTSWGELAINSLNGLKATAKPATHFDNSSSASSSSVPANQPPVAKFTSRYTVGCLQATFTLTAEGSFDPDGDQLSYEWSGSGSGTGFSTQFTAHSGVPFAITLKVTDSKGASTSISHNFGTWYFDCWPNHSSSSVSSSSSRMPSSNSSSSRTSASSSRYPIDHSASSTSSSVPRSSTSSSSVATTKAQCSYVVNSQWNNGFTAAIRIKNTTTVAINGWDVNWQYSDGSKVTNLWNATLSGSNPYNAKNLSWNSTIQPGQTVEFGFQGSKSAAAATTPVVTGNICQ